MIYIYERVLLPSENTAWHAIHLLLRQWGVVCLFIYIIYNYQVTIFLVYVLYQQFYCCEYNSLIDFIFRKKLLMIHKIYHQVL